jgi:intracellular sulfur oxidation DsrE/DsrF family protein
MKRLFAVASLLLVSGTALLGAQTPKDYKVVFDLTSRESAEQTAVLRWISEIMAESPNAKLEVVMYGKGLELVMADRTSVQAQVTEALKNPNVSFRVCAGSMKNNKVDKSQLMEGVTVVPDGIYEIISKQREGWGYIKVMH